MERENKFKGKVKRKKVNPMSTFKGKSPNPRFMSALKGKNLNPNPNPNPMSAYKGENLTPKHLSEVKPSDLEFSIRALWKEYRKNYSYTPSQLTHFIYEHLLNNVKSDPDKMKITLLTLAELNESVDNLEMTQKLRNMLRISEQRRVK